MTDYFVVDAHLHTYKTVEIGMQAMAGAGQAGLTGVPDEILQIMDESGIDLAIQVNMTPARSMYEAAKSGVSPEDFEAQKEGIRQKIVGRIIRRNQWTCDVSAQNPKLVPFISVDPIMTSDEMVAEVKDKFADSGAKGIKLHPSEGNFYPTVESLDAVYELAQESSIPIITHGGSFGGDEDFSRPSGFTKILEKFPELTLVIAHLGQGFFDETLEVAQKFPNVCFDTSAILNGTTSSRMISDQKAIELIRKIGTNRVMFGTDYPWFHPGKDLERHTKLDLSEDEIRAILGENAKRIFKL